MQGQDRAREFKVMTIACIYAFKRGGLNFYSLPIMHFTDFIFVFRLAPDNRLVRGVKGPDQNYAHT